jgi:hypothetical protein
VPAGIGHHSSPTVQTIASPLRPHELLDPFSVVAIASGAETDGSRVTP